MKTKVNDEIDVTDLVISIDRNSEINSEILAQMKMLTNTCQDSSEELKRNAQIFIDNQNPTAIIGSKKFTNGFIVGSLVAGLIGIVACIGISYQFYNKALQLKYDDYKAKVFADQIQLEKDYKSKLADLTNKEKKLGKSKKDLEHSLSNIEFLKKLKKSDLDKILYFIKDDKNFAIAGRVAGNDVLLNFMNDVYQYEKNGVAISKDYFDYVGEITDDKGKKYYHLKHK